MVNDALEGHGRTLALLALAFAIAVGGAWQVGLLDGGETLRCGELTDDQRDRYENVYGEGEIPTRTLASFDGDVGDAVARAIGGASRNETGPGVPVDGSFERDPFFVEANGTVYRCATDG